MDKKKQSQNKGLAICFKICACLCFAGINILVRYLSGGTKLSAAPTIPVYQIDFFQNLFGALILIPWSYSQNTLVWTKRHRALHLARASLGLLGVGLWYMSLKHMPIAKACALSFLGPIISALGAQIFLKEQITSKRGLALITSFIGSFLILRPDAAWPSYFLSNFTWLLPLGSAVAFAATNILTRVLAYKGETPEGLASSLLILMLPLSLFLALFNWVSIPVDCYFWLVILGLLAALAHLCIAKAYALAELTYLMPYGIIKFLSSVALAWALFNEVPNDQSVWIGLGTLLLGIYFLKGKA